MPSKLRLEVVIVEEGAIRLISFVDCKSSSFAKFRRNEDVLAFPFKVVLRIIIVPLPEINPFKSS